ncbi:hypothetical protein M067_3504 [Bacteroides fragilis str. J-143-4]|nr:hypothetical protein M067_3504 [Bacteroides fragilis str. J-143-4]
MSTKLDINLLYSAKNVLKKNTDIKKAPTQCEGFFFLKIRF